MQITWIRVIQSLQALFAIIELGLMSYVVDWYNGAPSRPSFLLFTSIWTLIIALPFLIFAPKHAPQAAQPHVLMAIEFITMIFWFSGFVALAVLISGWAGSPVVHRMRAGVVFAAFNWYESISNHAVMGYN
ncbi:hypothetical protein KEM54_005711 [Ascosphaera aggregata]|nr:hypothetical protein KEM54_005711 [Ascosphaera aggregata]